jgi:hypothetical protein
LDAAGFALQAGRLGLVDFSQCCTWPSCFGNNPSSPYLAILMSRAVGQTEPNTAEGADGTGAAEDRAADLQVGPARAKAGNQGCCAGNMRNG